MQKRIYQMDGTALRRSIQETTRRHYRHREVWEAYMYRAAVLRSQMKVADATLIIHCFATVGKRVDSFLDYMLDGLRGRLHNFRLGHLALLLVSVCKLRREDKFLVEAALPVIYKKLTAQAPPKDIAVLAHAYVRIDGPSRQAVLDRVAAAIAPRIRKLENPLTLSLLLHAFTFPPPHMVPFTKRASFLPSNKRDDSGGAPAGPSATEAETPEAAVLRDAASASEPIRFAKGGSDESEAGDGLPHRALIQLLLDQASKHLHKFRSTDLMFLFLSMQQIFRRDKPPPPPAAAAAEGAEDHPQPGEEEWEEAADDDERRALRKVYGRHLGKKKKPSPLDTGTGMVPFLLLRQVTRQLQNVLFELRGPEFIKLLSTFPDIPPTAIDSAVKARVLEELRYRVADLVGQQSYA
ncbi:unnamed protein product [Vitrella brassicaformis CCMP3155]|uniref:Uncharacterized protein n=1 Tax=Vitrella brassicaformis (strain CCMP3155) TaxID=1169540 RepID=A0A0G4EQU2_VITBC|nr:unnamed protein product [Vitrella brassicaformis CCMP3155]|eukprot:CEL99843.1 unnamed protein product [Vitrella brassicaformis CCMP3155]